MKGTLVIARDIPGLTQHVKHGFNGYIVPFDCTPDDLVKAINYVKINFCKRYGHKMYIGNGCV